MRVAKTDTIAGLPAGLARSVVRMFRGRERVAEAVEDLLEGTGFDYEAVLAELESAGYMEKVRVDTDGDVWWVDHPGQCPGDGELWETDQQKDRRPLGGRVGGTGACL